MTGIKDGATYAPKGAPKPVVAPGDFNFAAACLDHGHIYGQTQGLLEAGATLTQVYDPDPQKVAAFRKRFPQAAPAPAFEALLDNPSLHLIAAAAIPNARAGIGAQVLAAGKHYFTDKGPFTSLQQLEEARQAVAQSGRRYFVYYSERLHNEAAWRAGELIEAGAIGRALQVLCLAPHRLAKATRPPWFFRKAAYGGVLADIGSHQAEQFLAYTGCEDAEVTFARVANLGNPDTPELEDFGEFALLGAAPPDKAGASFYARVDWFTPEAMPVWGDGRTFVLGTEGTLEVRKYVDLGRKAPASLILSAGSKRVETIDCLGQIGYPFFGKMILDALNGTETAMTQAHTFKAAELALKAQALADAQRG